MSLLSAIGTISSAQIQNLVNTPITLIPAPGAGNAIEIQSLVMSYVPGTTPYSSASAMNIMLGLGPNWLATFLLSTAVAGLVGYYSTYFPQGSPYLPVLSSTKDNLPLLAQNQGGINPVGGDGVINYDILYRIIAL